MSYSLGAASSISDQILRILAKLGLQTPAMRALALGGAAAAGLYVVKPTFMFNDDGSMRPWKIVDSTPQATAIPFFVGVAAASAVGYFFL